MVILWRLGYLTYLDPEGDRHLWGPSPDLATETAPAFGFPFSVIYVRAARPGHPRPGGFV